jgi:glucose/arabinose dehydrogenase
VPRAAALASALAATFLLGVASSSDGATSAYRFKPYARSTAVTSIAAAPGSPAGRLYVVERSGRIRIFERGKPRPKPFLDLTGQVLTRGEEQGLLSIAFHPGFARNRRFFVYTIDLAGNTRVTEYRATKDGLGVARKSARRIFELEQPGPEHNGGQLAFGPDGRLWLGLGDGECCDDPANRAQDLGQPFGKLLRFDVSRASPQPTVAALGLRNPWRFSFDRSNGDLYVGDVGAGLWEEVDVVPRARLDELVNFGWDAWEGREVKETKDPNPAGRLVFPVYAYGHDEDNCSITGGFVYRGSAVPEARGRYFFGDYCTGSLWSLRMANGEAVDVRRESGRIPGLSTFGEDARGELYAGSVTDGRIYRLTK